MNKPKKEDKLEEAKEKKSFWSYIVGFFKFIKIIGAVISGVISFLFFIFFLMIIINMFSGIGESLELQIPQGNIAVVPLNGIITTGNSGSLFGENVINSKKIIKLIDKINKKEEIKAVIFEIDSPGGSPVASEEIASAIKQLNNTKNSVITQIKTNYSYSF